MPPKRKTVTVLKEIIKKKHQTRSSMNETDIIDLNPTLQPKKTQVRQIIIDSNSDEVNQIQVVNILKTLKINAYDTVNILYNKNEIEENDWKEREL
ncbi:5264_t:CDS:2, partial [Funneliformis geosporum]